MEQYKIDFIHLLVRAEALKFGEFELKSGRVAPYFLNMGQFYSGPLMHDLARFYAEAMLATEMKPDIIFGPAYKGIPLAAVTATVLHSEFGEPVNYAYNRKEAKNHGASKGKRLVGAPISADSRVMLIDDVITAGTAIRESIALLREEGMPKIEGVLIALNRMEKTNEGINTIAQIADMMGAPVHSIVTLDEMIEVLHNQEIDGEVVLGDKEFNDIQAYRTQYGID